MEHDLIHTMRNVGMVESMRLLDTFDKEKFSRHIFVHLVKQYALDNVSIPHFAPILRKIDGTSIQTSNLKF